jgi:hypothetical protein
LGAGFELIQGGAKLYFWFHDPFTGRDAMLKGSDENEATIKSTKDWSGADEPPGCALSAPLPDSRGLR